MPLARWDRGEQHLLLISKQNENEIVNEMPPPKPTESMQNFCYCRQINFTNAGGGGEGAAGPTKIRKQREETEEASG